MSPDTRPDPLAALLHDTVCDSGDRYGYHPFCETFAARLRAAGVTLTQPQPDAGLREALRESKADAENQRLRAERLAERLYPNHNREGWERDAADGMCRYCDGTGFRPARLERTR